MFYVQSVHLIYHQLSRYSLNLFFIQQKPTRIVFRIGQKGEKLYSII
nr:MAG TPA: hypothetical protein [Caudoviricetes sp.]